MIQTQIQLTEQQSIKLEELAAREDVSITELILRAVDQLLATSHLRSDAEQRRRALEFAGKFRSGVHDLSINHDLYLVEAYETVEPPEL